MSTMTQDTITTSDPSTTTSIPPLKPSYLTGEFWQTNATYIIPMATLILHHDLSAYVQPFALMAPLIANIVYTIRRNGLKRDHLHALAAVAVAAAQAVPTAITQVHNASSHVFGGSPASGAITMPKVAAGQTEVADAVQPQPLPATPSGALPPIGQADHSVDVGLAPPAV